MPDRLVLGIDPGVASTGVGVVRERDRRFESVAYDVIRTPASQAFPDRLAALHRACGLLLKQYRPDVMALERLFFTKNAKTAIAVGQAQGVILLAASQARTPVYDYTPVEVKSAVTGDGRADKPAVAFMIQRLLALAELPRPDDAADALAVAYCHLVSTRRGITAPRRLLGSHP
ncbi:MAG: crossover junction endodeoxyribonuclease RuvC [bacterium]